MMPIIALTEAANLPLGILGAMSGDAQPSLDNFFAHYIPLPGTALIDQELAQYPFANQTVAANSIITKPLNVSFHMIVPARGPGAYVAKLPIMMALQKVFEEHSKAGGTYTLLTPSFIYMNCILTSMRDVSSASTLQVQNMWQLDFAKPLITVQDALNAQGAMNNLMNQFTSGSPGDAATTGLTPGTAIPPTNAATLPAIGNTNAVGSITSSPLPPMPSLPGGVSALPQGPLGGGGV
jgi:hypothetical protein